MGRKLERGRTRYVDLRIPDSCPYCGGDMTNPQKDHIIPVCRGGRSTKRNMVYVCRDCNLSKGQLSLGFWLKRRGYSVSVVKSRLVAMGKSAAGVPSR